MSNSGLGKWLGSLTLTVILTFVGVLWLGNDVQAAATGTFVFKLAALLLLAVGACAFMWQHFVRRFSKRLAELESFVSTLPLGPAVMPAFDSMPPEIEPLAQALRTVSTRIRDVVDSASLEVSRREAILSCMAEGVLAVDGRLNVVFCNDAFANAFNAPTRAAEGRMLFEVVREPVLRDVLGRVMRTGQQEAARVQLPSAGSRWFEARALPLASLAERGALIVLHDITDIQNQEQLRKDFVADVSHELRTPLAAIRGYAETLLNGALDDTENNKRFVEIILSHAIRLNNIASDLLVLSEMDAQADSHIPPESIPVLDVIDSAMNSVQNAASLRGVKLDRTGCVQSFVLGHRFRMEQVISNLLDNAVKFNRPSGEVSIECGPVQDGLVRIAVSDTGSGIPQADIKRIFERFYRVDKARARSTGGTGLGLPIVKEVVDRMGGSVSVESQLGKGSKFIILLKAAPATETA